MSEMKEVKRYLIRFSELDGWGVSCASVANRGVVLASAYDALRAQLPEGMEHCTIKLDTCAKCQRSWLQPTNWVNRGCPHCERAALLSEKAALAAENERLREELTQRICKAVPMTEWEKLVADRDRLRTAIAGAREAIELALRCIDGHTPVDYCPERVRHNNAKDQLRALSAQPSVKDERTEVDVVANINYLLHDRGIGGVPRPECPPDCEGGHYALSAQPSGALEREKCDACRGVGTVLASGHWPHDVQARCEACDGTGQQPAPPPERAPGVDAASYHWGNPPFPRWPAETVDSMAEIGEAFMEALPKDYSWCQSPSEIIADLQNQLDDASAAPPPSSSPSATADATLRAALNDLIRAYVNMLESARERIVAHGGQCDSVEMMERADPRLAAARAALAGNEGEK